MKQWFAGLLISAAVLPAVAATEESKVLYQQAKAQANDSYKAQRAKCNVLAGTAKDICVAEAQAVQIHAEQDAWARYKDTLAAYTKARMNIAAANYKLDKARCAALGGNDKDVCLQQARSTRIAAEADAKADKKTIEARADARDDKRTAEYKVALEKCDAFAGAVKDNCVSTAKAQYGQ
jgi:hypothetical protein